MFTLLALFTALSVGLISAVFALRAYLLSATLPKNILESTDFFLGKTTLITGATDGIGLATAIQIYKMGSNLIIGARNAKKAEEKIEIIKASRKSSSSSSSKDNAPTIYCLPLDLSSLESTRGFVEAVKNLNVKIDYLINNAGVYYTDSALTKDGFEQSWQTNHLSPFLLTTRLLDTLNKNARIINVSSGAHHRAWDYKPLTMEDVKHDMSKSPYSSFFGYYGLSKLCNILFAKELQRRVPSDVTVASLHPGYVQTPMARKAFGFVGPIVHATERFLAKTPLQGAYTTIHIMTADDIEKGAYYLDCKKERSSKASNNPEFAKKLWELSEECIKQ